MPSAEEWVAYYYPFLLDEADPRHVSTSELDMALAVAANERPACLSADRQNEAQAHFAAYVVAFRREAQAAGAGLNGGSADVVAGPVVRRREGDLEIQYATSGGATQTVATQRANLTGPGTPYAAWARLAALCGAASDVPTPGVLPVRRGAIVTSAG